MSEQRSGMFVSDPVLRKLAFTTVWGFLALGFGSGLFRKAPGTAGTVVAIPFALALLTIPTLLSLLIVLSLFVVGVPLCRVTETALGQSDPGSIVWDEIVGFLLVAILVPAGWPWLLGAFVAFRFFDIVKPWPIRWFEKRLSGGFGIMFDDAVAALYSVVLLWLAEVLVSGVS
ncbi:MAG TPA: phosphatidylglycerophosphatase A [Xanthomonadales bacterium]|nr:phosphatidylglycerophosphatase A [Xanthomonadales bacterium]